MKDIGSDNRCGSGKWGDIVKVGKDIEASGISFYSSFVKKMGNGLSTRFWLDPWIGDGVVLKEKFPRLFRLELNESVSVGEMRSWNGDTWGWSWRWVRSPRGRGLGDLTELTNLITFFIPNVLISDSWRWTLDKDGCFTVKGLRELIDGKILGQPNRLQTTKWNKTIPRKVCIFIWRLQQKRVPVFDWLNHLGIDLNSILCSHCGNEIETVEHCFLRCHRVRKGWEKIFKWWNMGPYNINSLEDILDHKGQNNFCKKQKVIWQAVCWSMLYHILSARNKRVFEKNIQFNNHL